MKFLPRLVPLSLVALSLASVSCATPANRRALYFSTKPHGPWTDYERRRQSEAATGVVAGSTAINPVAGPAPMQPKPEAVTPPPAVVVPPVEVPPAPDAPPAQ